MTQIDEPVDWVLIGGGVAGLASALALTGQFGTNDPLTAGSILIVDAHRLGHGASMHNPGRGQGGFHYPDRKSADELQDVLIYNAIHYPEWFSRFFSRKPDGELVRSWYAILPDDPSLELRSYYPNLETVELFDHLARRWDSARASHPILNEIGDEPFAQWIDPDEAFQRLGTDRYFRLARTLEPNLDVNRFVANMRDAALSHPSVSALENDVVTEIGRLPDRQPDGARFVVTTQREGERSSIRARNLNVCAWEATEALLAPLGYQFDTLNRIKGGFKLRLAPSSHEFPSTIAVYGSHAMVRNYYDGTAFCTVAKITNFVRERVPDVDAELSNLISHKHFGSEEHSAQVREQLHIYFPGLEVESVSDPEFGVVKVASKTGKIDLEDPHGDQNFRITDGLSRNLEDGLWTTWSMKLVSCFKAAEQFRDSVAERTKK